MRKPTKPKAPKKPEKPEEFKGYNIRIHLRTDAEQKRLLESGLSEEEFDDEYDEYEYEEYDSDKVFSFDSIMDQVNSYIESTSKSSYFGPWPKTNFSMVKKPIEFSDISFCMHASSHDWSKLAIVKLKFRNKKYKAELDQYKKDLAAYEKKKKTYDAACKKYTVAQREYLKYEAGIKKQEKISKLKKELKELQS